MPYPFSKRSGNGTCISCYIPPCLGISSFAGTWHIRVRFVPLWGVHRHGCEQQCNLCRSRAGLFLQHPGQHPNPLSSLCPSDQAGCGSASLGPSWTVAEAGWKVRCHGGETSDPGWGMARRKGALPTTTGLRDMSLLDGEGGAVKIAGAPSLGTLYAGKVPVCPDT